MIQSNRGLDNFSGTRRYSSIIKSRRDLLNAQISRGTNHYAYACQTQVNRKKENNRKEEKGVV